MLWFGLFGWLGVFLGLPGPFLLASLPRSGLPLLGQGTPFLQLCRPARFSPSNKCLPAVSALPCLGFWFGFGLGLGWLLVFVFGSGWSLAATTGTLNLF